jgi:hypothetical protein
MTRPWRRQFGSNDALRGGLPAANQASAVEFPDLDPATTGILIVLITREDEESDGYPVSRQPPQADLNRGITVFTGPGRLTRGNSATPDNEGVIESPDYVLGIRVTDQIRIAGVP